MRSLLLVGGTIREGTGAVRAGPLGLRDRAFVVPEELRGPPAVDLGDACAVPGLIDAHLHLSLGAESLLELDLSGCRSRAEFEAALARRHAELPEGAWLVARGWNEDGFPGREAPDRSWLAATGRRPTVCWRMDAHACVANDAVLERLDLAADPPGGRIVRDAGGRPTGLLQEAAAWALVQPIVPPPDADRRRAAVRDAAKLLASLGLTAVGSMEYRAAFEGNLVPQRDRLGVRVRATILDRDFDRAWHDHLAFARDFPSDPRLAIVGMKAFLDGTLGSRTARMLEAYADDPGQRGLLVELAERGVLVDWIRAVRAAGLSPAMHAIGDEAARLALEAAEASDGLGSRAVRVEHAQTVHRADLPRFAGRIASMQPLHKAYDARTAPSRLGPDRMDRFFPFRSLRAHGATLAFGSDWPIVSPDPLRSMRAAITGLDVDGNACRIEESLTPAEALEAHTLGAARCLGASDLGCLRAGCRADLTILDRDPLGCDWVDAPPRVLATIMDGRCTYLAPEAPFAAAIRDTLEFAIPESDA